MAAERGHIGQIDGLRALAITGVLYAHFWNPASYLGDYGVSLFFSISGYLITDILLRARAEAAAQGSGRGMVLRAFWARRALRILPIYYGVLLVAGLWNLEGIRETILWHAGFASNILFALQGNWGPRPVGHLWSLSVEEQFYLLWPLLLLWLPVRLHLRLAAATILLGIAGSALLMLLGATSEQVFVLTPVVIDALGWGCLIAMLSRHPNRVDRLLRAAWPAAMIWLACLALEGRHPALDALGIGMGRFVLAMVVAKAITGFGGPFGRALESAPLRALGQVSYGVYLYHLFAITALTHLAARIGLAMPGPGPAQFLIGTLATLAVAIPSWHLVERPVNRLKRHFPYAADRRIPAGVSAPGHHVIPAAGLPPAA